MTASEWLTMTVGDTAKVKGGKRLPAGYLVQAEPTPHPYIRVTDMRDGGIEDSDIKYVPTAAAPSIRAYRIRTNDIFISVAGTLGIVGRIPEWLDGANLTENADRITDIKCDVDYLAQYLRSAPIQNEIESIRTVGAQPKLALGRIKTFELLIPEDREEQARVAQALGDADRLIDSLERLIAKKRAIKQGVMQELLTGKTPLPGFSGDWRSRQIGDFTDVKAGGTPSTAIERYWGGDIRWMSSGEVHQKRVREVTGRITRDGLAESAAQLLPVGTVLMALAGQGKTRGTVAISHVELATNQSIAGILPGPEHDSDFLYYNLDTRYDELRGESAGDGGRGGLNLTIIKKLVVRMPDVEEQKAIAQVLVTADAEITALERRLESARALKQGMMQELLTGRTRLVAEGVAA